MSGKVAPLIKEFYPEYYSIERYTVSQCAPFCKVQDKWGIFSNFGKTPITINGIVFSCVEKLFQCLKFDDNESVKDVYYASPKTNADSYGVRLKSDEYVGPNLMGRLLMELRDNGKFDVELPSTYLNNIELLK